VSPVIQVQGKQRSAIAIAYQLLITELNQTPRYHVGIYKSAWKWFPLQWRKSSFVRLVITKRQS